MAGLTHLFDPAHTCTTQACLHYSGRPLLGFEVAPRAEGNGVHVNAGADAHAPWRWLTYTAAMQSMRTIVRLLRAHGVPRRAFVGISAENSPPYALAMLAAMWGEQVLVPISLHLSDDHFHHVLQEAGIKALFTSPATHERCAKLAAGLGITLLCLLCQDPVQFHTGLTERLAACPPVPADVVLAPEAASGACGRLQDDDPVLILYTSGSTGVRYLCPAPVCLLRPCLSCIVWFRCTVGFSNREKIIKECKSGET